MDRFDIEIERILNELYYNPLEGMDGITKRAVLTVEYRYLEYLSDLELIKILNTQGGGRFAVQLLHKGYEVFEKYDNWSTYKTKVIDSQKKVELYKNRAAKYWWIPILISGISLFIAVLAFLKNNS